MAIRLNPYISFNGAAREAMDFYQSVLGGQLDVTSFGDFGMDADGAPPEQVMHAMLVTPSGLTLMASDTPPGMTYEPPAGMSIALFGDKVDEATMRAQWAGLSAGGTELTPLEAAPWGDVFGMFIDRFGVTWMLNIAAN